MEIIALVSLLGAALGQVFLRSWAWGIVLTWGGLLVFIVSQLN